MDTVRVLHVVGNSKFGGASSIIIELCQLVRRNGWQVDVLAEDPVFQHAVTDAGLGLVALPGINREIRPWKDLAALIRLWKFLRNGGYTLVHTHTSKGGFLGRLAARMAGVPVIVHTAHGFAIHETSPLWQKVSYVLLERTAASCCDAVACVSEFHRDWGARLHLAPASKLLAIPNGISPARIRRTLPPAVVRRSLGVPPNVTVLLCPSRLAPQKGIEDLLQAAVLLRNTLGSAFHLYIAGEGPSQNEYRDLSRRLGLTDQVTFLGFRDDVPNLLAAADLVVLPSIREGLSLSLLEAMAASKPIVATTIGSNREVQAALLVEPGQPPQLAAAITRLCQDPELAACLGAYAGAVLHNRYTEDRMIQDYWRLYLQLMSRKGILASNPPASIPEHKECAPASMAGPL